MEMLHLVRRNAGTADYVLIDVYSTTNFWYAYAVALLCQQQQLKYIPILHGGNLPARLKKSTKACNRIFRKAYLIVSPSLYLKEIFEKEGYTNIKYIPNSITLEQYEFKRRKTIRPRLLWVRAFAQIYNPMLALNVLDLVLKKYPEAELCMVGPDKDGTSETCRHYAERKNLPVKFTGKLSKNEWISLAADYDIFLNTTDVDNTPVSVIEAMALGLPVVSTNVGGIPYLIDQNKEGLLVPPNNSEEMAAAVFELIEKPEKAEEMSRAARKKVEAFDWELVKKKWKDILI